MLMRKTSTPASNSARIVEVDSEAGPRVARILVLRRRLIRSSFLVREFVGVVGGVAGVDLEEALALVTARGAGAAADNRELARSDAEAVFAVPAPDAAIAAEEIIEARLKRSDQQPGAGPR